MKSIKSPFFKVSIEYISKNLQVLSNETPNHLLDYWILENNSLGDTEDSPEFGVFMYPFLKFKTDKSINEFQLHTDSPIELFQTSK